MSAHSATESSPKRLKGLNDTNSVLDDNNFEYDSCTIQSMKTDYDTLREAIIDLYLDVKIRSSDEIDLYDTK